MTYLMDNRENEIGFFEVSNYIEHSKKIDEITVVCLGLILGIVFSIKKRQISLQPFLELNSF